MGKSGPRAYDAERKQIQPFLASLRSLPQASMRISNQFLWEHWREAGVLSRPHLGQYRRDMSSLLKRIDVCIGHCRGASRGGDGHVTDSVQLGARIRCIACGEVSPTHRATAWLARKCSKRTLRTTDQAIAALLALQADVQQLVQATVLASQEF